MYVVLEAIPPRGTVLAVEETSAFSDSSNRNTINVTKPLCAPHPPEHHNNFAIASFEQPQLVNKKLK